MASLTVTSRGQVTLRRDVLRHLGIEPGGKMELELLPNGSASLKAAQPEGSVEDFIGMLKGKSKKVATLEEIQQAIADGWAGKR